MFDPYSSRIEDIAVLFVHSTAGPEGKKPYALAALRLSPDGGRRAFRTLVRTDATRARDFMHSRVPRKALAEAPEAEEAAVAFRSFLEGVDFAVVYDPYEAGKALRRFTGNLRIIDAGFLADFFLPWAMATSPRRLWETVHGRNRDRVGIPAEEGAELAADFLRHLFGTVLDDTRTPAVRSLRYFLRTSETLMGSFCLHMLENFQNYFGGLTGPVNAEEDADWTSYLEEAPKRPEAKAKTGSEPFNPLPEQGIRQLFDQLAASKSGYRVREPQVTYAGHTARAFNTGSVACIEAGTGTGKTLGYLLPVLEFLRRNPERRAAIATYTKSLQDQLYGSELTAARELFGHYADIPTALVKGKSNYVCARKLDDVLHPGLRGPDLLAWLFFAWVCWNHRLADCDAISPRLRGLLDGDSRRLSGLLQEVSAGSGCWSGHTRCPAQVAAAEAAGARLVITNHTKLVLMENDPALAGLFRHLVIDEANHFEDAVRSALAPEISTADIRDHCRLIAMQLRSLLTSPGLDPDKRARAVNGLEVIRELGDHLEGMRHRFTRMDRSCIDGETVVECAHEAFTDGHVGAELARLETLLTALQDQTAMFSGKEAKDLPLPYKSISRARTRRILLLDAVEAVRHLRRSLERDDTWQSVRAYPKGFALSGGQVNVGGMVREVVLRGRDSTVFTSATITHRGSFDHFRSGLGLGRGPSVLFASAEEEPAPPPMPIFVTRVAPPFVPDYSLVVPSGTPGGDYRNKGIWLDHVLKNLPDLIDYNGGATLVLCASYDDLDRIREGMERTYDGSCPLLFQRRGESPTALCEEFRAARESVLFGVETLWHGVDFPGDTLTQVVITRLPYPSPSSPLLTARRKVLSDAAYWDRYRYDTAIKFRQGTGRLVRRETDTGMVVVLDSRLLKNRNLSSVRVVEGLERVPPRHRGGKGR